MVFLGVMPGFILNCLISKKDTEVDFRVIIMRLLYSSSLNEK